MSAKYKSPSFLLPNELNTSANPATGTGVNSLYSMDFDGSSEYVDLNDNNIINGFTSVSFSFWVNVTTGDNYDGILCSRNGSDYILIYIDNVSGSNFKINIQQNTTSGGSYTVTSSPTVTFGNWYNVVCAGTVGGKWDLYINGDNTGQTQGSNNITAITQSSNFLLGSDGLIGGRYLNCLIDEVAIFNRALDSTEIAALYGGTSPNIYPSNLMATNLNPIAYYPLGEQAQNTGYVGSGNPGSPNTLSNVWQFPNGVLQDYVMDFNAANYISTSHISLSSAFSASAWVNTTDTSTYGNIFSSDQAPVGGAIRNWQLVRFNATARFILRNSSGGSIADAYDLNVVINDGKWHHILATWDGTTGTNKVKIYIDGDLAAQDTASSTSLRNDTVLMIMGGSSATWDFIGKISNVAIWNSDQSSNKDNIYNNGSPQTSYTVSPQNWWKLNADSVYTPSAPNYTTALDFVTSESDYINLGSGISQSFSELSISTWINAASTASGAYDTIIRRGTWSAGAFELRNNLSYSGLKFAIYPGTANVTTTGVTLNDGNWHHILVTYDGTNVKIYVDGSLNNSSTNGTGATGTNTQITTIGASDQGTSRYYEGKISNAAIFNSALIPSQVSTLFNFGTPETNISFNPQAWWKLDDQTAITDSSGNGNTGTNNGATDATTSVAVVPSWKIPSALNIPTVNYTTALSFNGTSDYIQGGNIGISGNATFSISYWAYWDGSSFSSNYPSVVGNNTFSVSNGLSTTWRDGRPALDFWTVRYRADNALLTQRWYHLVFTKTQGAISTTSKIYVNGVEVNGSLEGTDTNPNITNSNLIIGRLNNTSTRYWNGFISNVAIFNSALTASQVSTLFNSGQPEAAISFSPVSWWKLDTGGSTITDYGSGGNNGTNNGASPATSDVFSGVIPVNGVSTTLPSTALQQSDLQFDSPYSNYSLNFDGTGDYILANTSVLSGLSTASISMWLNVDSISATRGILSLSDGAVNDEITLSTFNSRLYVRIRNASTNFKYSSDWASQSANTWIHLCLLYDGNEVETNRIKVYLNNSLINFGSVTGSTPVTLPTFTQLTIGNDIDGSNFEGKIDETSIFNYSLSEAQILEIYNNGRPKDLSTFSGTAPVSWWRLGENAYFDNNSFIVPNSISGAPNGTGSGTINTMISADAPGTYANGVGTNLDIVDRVGDAALSTSNSQSYNMIPSDISPYVPQYVGNQIANNFSMTFDGVDDRFNFQEISLPNEFALSFWMKPVAFGVNGSQYVIGQWGVNTNNIKLDQAGQIHFKIGGTTVIFNENAQGGSNNLIVNVWQHIVLTRNSSNVIKCFRNATSYGSPTGATNSNTLTYDSIGRVISNTFGFEGELDEVAIWNTALNAGQIYNDIYQPTATGTNQTADLENNPNLPTPVAWYRMGD